MKTLEEFRDFYATNLLPQLRPLDKERKMVIVKGIIGGGMFIILGVVVSYLIIKFAPKEDRLGWIVLSALVSGVLAVFTYLQMVSDRRYYKKFKYTVIENIIKYLSENLNYYPTRKVPVKLFLESGLFTKPPHRYKGDDMIAGKLTKNIFIEGSEVEAYFINKTQKEKKLEKLFHGLFFLAAMDEELKGTTLIVPKNKTIEEYHNVGLKDLKECEINNETFKNNFNVFSDNPEECKKLLNENVLNVIIEYKNNHPKNKLMVSFRKNKIYFAVEYNKELFEPKLYKSLIDKKTIEEYYDDIVGTVNIVKSVYMTALKEKLEV